MRTGGVRSLSTSSEEEGGSGSSGMPLGGDGVSNAIFDTFTWCGRFGVTFIESGGENGGDGGGEKFAGKIKECVAPLSLVTKPRGYTSLSLD